MASRFFALFIWAAVAVSVAYWGLRWLAAPSQIPPQAGQVSLESSGQGDLHRLLGAGAAPDTPVPAAQPELASRVKLIGVVAQKGEQSSRFGVALLSIDGKPPRAIRVGDTLNGLNGDVVLKNLTQRGAEIGPASGPSTLLELPGFPAPNSGNLTNVAQIDRTDQGIRVSIEGPAGARPSIPQPTPVTPQMMSPSLGSNDSNDVIGNLPPPAAGPSASRAASASPAASK